MSSAADHGRTVLAAIIPDRGDRLDLAARSIKDHWFVDKVQRNLWRFLVRYQELAGSVITKEAVSDLLERLGRGEDDIILHEETYDALAQREVSDDALRWSVEMLKDLAAERETAQALTEAMQILKHGAIDASGVERKGHKDARSHALISCSAIDRDIAEQDAPEGDMLAERQDMLDDYQARRDRRQTGLECSPQFGVEELDERTGGMQAGELCLLLAYTSAGKSSLLAQAAWHSCTQLGLNVVIMTSETLRSQMRRKIIARHSKAPAFNLRDGLDSKEIRRGTLSPQHEKVMEEVVDDLTGNPNYGKLYIAQVGRGEAISQIEARLCRLERQFKVDFVCFDYLALFRADRKRTETWQERADVVLAGKQMATTFADGRGVPILSPWQVTRAAQRESGKGGSFEDTLIAAGTAEASNSADLLISMVNVTNNDSRYNELKMQVLKARDGQVWKAAIAVDADYATCCFASKGMTTPTAMLDDEDTLSWLA